LAVLRIRNFYTYPLKIMDYRHREHINSDHDMIRESRLHFYGRFRYLLYKRKLSSSFTTPMPAGFSLTGHCLRLRLVYLQIKIKDSGFNVPPSS
jgi:hypothetical protein